MDITDWTKQLFTNKPKTYKTANKYVLSYVSREETISYFI